jgi:hypothetical protein
MVNGTELQLRIRFKNLRLVLPSSLLNLVSTHARALLRRCVQQTRFNLPRLFFEGTA